MIVFQLTMPHAGSWNGKWTGDGRVYAKTRPNREVPPEVVGRDFTWEFDDGWAACVSATKMDAKDAAKIMRQSKGFFGYDWMIDSIIRIGRTQLAEGGRT
jgi:hypothetical protein